MQSKGSLKPSRSLLHINVVALSLCCCFPFSFINSYLKSILPTPPRRKKKKGKTSICHKMAEWIGTVVSIFEKYVVRPIGYQISYLVCFRSKAEGCRKQVEKLELLKDKVQRSLVVAKRKGENIEPEVEKWLTVVEKVTGDVEKLEDEVKKSSSNGWCSDWTSRYWLSRELKKTTLSIARLQEEGKFSKVSYSAPSPGIESLPTGDCCPFQTTVSAMNQIIELLKGEECSTICVYGMGGVGKTTLVKEVGKKVKKDKLFDEVAIAVVSQAPDLIKIQDEIADALGLEFHEEKEIGRAGRLRERLKTEKRVLVILDDVWERLDLGAIGIPHGVDHRGCKILLTTRREHTCNVMGSQATKILLNILNEQESWALFRSNAGATVDSPAVNVVATEIAKKCGGLPLALVAVGRALSDKDIDGWQEAAKQLKECKPMNIQDVDADFFSCLKLSFDYLQGEEIKSIFLLCCLFPEDRNIELEYLTRLAMGQGLLEDVETVEEGRRRVRTLIKGLKASCLLMDGDKSKGSLKMHDLVRVFAISITSTEKYAFMVKAGVGLKNWPKKGTFEHFTLISLMANNISSLPVGLECPKLHTLLLGGNRGLKTFPDAFFEGMKALKVLDLTAISKKLYRYSLHITPLPASLQLLTDLRMLHLHHRKLGDISILGKLKKLEILSFFASHISELPKEMGELKNLKLLDLTYCRSLKKIPPNLISGLSALEELYMRGSFQQWDVGGTTIERSSASLSELNSLLNLTTLHVEIINAKCIPNSFLFPNQLRFQIYIGSKLSFATFTRKLKYDYPTSKALELKGIDSPIPIGVKMLFERTEDLSLISLLEGSRNILPNLGSRGFNGLTSLSVRNCVEFECIIDTTQGVHPVAFPNIETIHLTHLCGMKVLSSGTLPMGSFRKLRVLTVEQCGGLSTLFPADLLQLLQNLEIVQITCCQEMQDVFQIEGILVGEEHVLPLSSLRELKLDTLPQLEHLWKGFGAHLSLHNLEVIEIERCNRLRNLFQPSIAQSLFKLEYLKIVDCMELQQIIAEDGLEQEVSNVEDKKSLNLPKLKVLEVEDCKKLKSLFSVSSAQSFLQLKQLKVSGSNELKAIISCECGEISAAVDKFVLPQLSNLELKALPVLESFCKGNFPFEWPSLEEVVVDTCPRMTTFALAAADGVQNMPKLKSLQVDGQMINNHDLNMAIKHLYKGKVHFTNLMYILSMVKLTKGKIYSSLLKLSPR